MTIFETAKQIPITRIIDTFYHLDGAHTQSGNTVMPCPFHSEKTASFTINERKNYFHCFGCGQGGDGIKFVEKLYSLRPKAAALLICETFGLYAGPSDTPETQESLQKAKNEQERQKMMWALTEWANQAYVRLCELRRTHFIALGSFEELNIGWVTRLEYIDYLLDLLQYGEPQDKLNLNRAVRRGELGLAGAWLRGQG